jgi:VIT1/CCC1 family predicted Fe2+/Mn2+ transporter
MALLTDSNLRRYLLGSLSDEEQTDFETALFQEQSGSERLGVAEDELIDAYVLKELSHEEERRFEEHFVTSRRIAERVRMAEALLQHAAAHRTAAASPVKIRRWFAPIPWASLRTRPLAAAAPPQTPPHTTFLPHMRPLAAAALVCICIASGLLGALIASKVAGDRYTAAARDQEQRFQRELSDRQKRLQGQIDAPSPARPPLLSFLLLPGARRGFDQTQQLTIPSRQITLALRTQNGQKYQRYRAVIIDGLDKQVWAGVVDGAAVADPQTVAFTVPAETLRPGDYTLALTGDPGTGGFRSIQDYVFSIARQ